MNSRYKPVGWRNESLRHSLAAKGLTKRYAYAGDWHADGEIVKNGKRHIRYKDKDGTIHYTKNIGYIGARTIYGDFDPEKGDNDLDLDLTKEDEKKDSEDESIGDIYRSLNDKEKAQVLKKMKGGYDPEDRG